MKLDDIPVLNDRPAPKAKQHSLADAVDALDDERQTQRDAEQLVGLDLYHCVNDLVRHPELLPRVRKIVCKGTSLADAWPTGRIGAKQREVLNTLAEGKLHFPEDEGRVHHMPAGNPDHPGLPSKWWITNLDYRKVLTRKLRGILQDMKDRGLL